MAVPFLDLKTQYQALRSEMEPAVLNVLSGGNYILGPEVTAFESEYAAFLKTKHVISVSNGLDALRLSLLAAGVGPGDEVITAANTFIATALAVTSVGARVVLVEPDEVTHNIDAEAISRAITPKTRALLPVHLYGQPAKMAPILALAREKKLAVIEDTAQSHGAVVDGQVAGTIGDMGCYSFYPGKNLGAYGDGGAISTNDDALAEKLLALRNYGQAKKYHHVSIGYNHRLDEVQAAILRIKLRHLARYNELRAQHAAYYSKALAGLPLTVPAVAPDRTHIFHLYVIRTAKRDALQAHLTSKGIGTIIHYPIPIHKQEAYANEKLGTFPLAERLAGEILSLPMYPELTPAQLDEVVAGVKSFFA